LLARPARPTACGSTTPATLPRKACGCAPANSPAWAWHWASATAASRS